jgi:hypothetical protein
LFEEELIIEESEEQTADIQNMFAREAQCLEESLEAGYKNVRENKKHLKSLEGTLPNGIVWRRFLLSFDQKQAKEYYKTQIREQDIDTKYCEEELYPLIKKHGLEYPGFVNLSEEIESANHRHYVFKKHWPEKLFPTIQISNPYVLDDNGHWVATKNPNHSEFIKVASRFKPNIEGRDKPLKLTMKDASFHITRLFRAAPNFLGLNPSGAMKDFTSEDKESCNRFDKIMDWAYPNQFLRANERTRIRRNVNPESRNIISIATAEWSSEATLLNWPAGLSLPAKKGKPPTMLSTGNWMDDKDGNLIFHLTTAGEKIKEKVLATLAKLYLENEGRIPQEIKGIKLLIKIGQAKSSHRELNASRQQFFSQQVNLIHQQLVEGGWPPITYVRFVKQLKDPKDIGLDYKLDKKTGTLVKK